MTRRGEGGGPGAGAATAVAGRGTNAAIGASHDGCASPPPCGERLALRQEMTISRAAFLRNLPGAVAHVPYCTQGDEFVHEEASCGWRIRVSPLPDLAIASLVLERHAVEVYLRGYDATSARGFLDRFELHFRRGGG